MKAQLALIGTVVLAGGAAALFAGVYSGRAAQQQPLKSRTVWKETPDGRPILPTGTLLDPQSFGKPGNPEHAEADFRRLYAAIDAYRRKHRRLPSVPELLDVSKPLAPGFHLSSEDLKNPDWRTAEGLDAIMGIDRVCHYTVQLGIRRPNGQPKPAFPGKGEKDVWLFSELNARTKTKLFPDGKRELEYSGEYVVLFSDGSIRRFKHGDLFWVRDSQGRLARGFPGMAGLSSEVVPFKNHPMNQPSEKQKITYR